MLSFITSNQSFSLYIIHRKFPLFVRHKLIFLIIIILAISSKNSYLGLDLPRTCNTYLYHKKLKFYITIDIKEWFRSKISQWLYNHAFNIISSLANGENFTIGLIEQKFLFPFFSFLFFI